ncbi:MAG: phosphate acyltransferase PlsX [Firmicutes bacterium]|nr:phosphate acyltransferase PlsX [Bacillota bacterium]
MVVVSLDAMGGDHAPGEIVRGAVEAVANYPVKVLLVGPEEAIRGELEKALREAGVGPDRFKEQLEIVPADQVIGMDEEPVMALRRKKNASIAVATRLVREGKAQAIVSAGSTGAQMAAAVLILGRLPGVERPAIATVLPGLKGNLVMLDSGANVDSRPKHLEQYAYMGSIYAANLLGIENPRVALLNVGEEEAKGNELTKQTYQLLKTAKLNFTGNIEGREVLTGGADVVVCDGFVGNVALKLTEGIAKALIEMIREELMSSLRTKLGALLAKPGFKALKDRLDYSEVGGAPLLGVKGISIICHGSSRARAIRHAVRVAMESVDNDLIGKLRVSLPEDETAEPAEE